MRSQTQLFPGNPERSLLVATRSPRPGLRRGTVLVLAALATVVLVEGLALRRARACGGPEIDYGSDKVVTQTHRGRTEVQLNFRRKELSFRGSNLNLSEVQIFTRDRRFAAWLATNGMGDKVWAEVKRVGAGTSCAALYDGRSIGPLERRFSNAVRTAYRKATGRNAAHADAMLVAVVLDGSEPSCVPPTR